MSAENTIYAKGSVNRLAKTMTVENLVGLARTALNAIAFYGECSNADSLRSSQESEAALEAALKDIVRERDGLIDELETAGHMESAANETIDSLVREREILESQLNTERAVAEKLEQARDQANAIAADCKAQNERLVAKVQALTFQIEAETHR
jgi:hypothetical protein